MMTFTPCFSLFDTPIGRCGIAWAADGIVRIQLPESRENETRARLTRDFPKAREAAPPAVVRQALNLIAAHLRGEAIDLSTITLDLSRASPFYRRVYETARLIPPGRTLSYGELADRLGSHGAARAVGQALRRNPFAIVVPCHRVLASNGKLGGFSANGGPATKLRLLSIEGGSSTEDAAFDFDPEPAIVHLRIADPSLRRLIDRVGPCHLELRRASSLFGILAEAIVHQQLSNKAAATIFARLRGLFPHAPDGPSPKQILRASDERLRGAGLSRAKVLSLRDLAQRTMTGELPTLAEIDRLPDALIIERLTEIRGIGRWTVEMLLIFRLGRPDVLPVGDFGLRKGFGNAFRKGALPTPGDVERRGERWKPYRTVASWYLWRAAELGRQ